MPTRSNGGYMDIKVLVTALPPLIVSRSVPPQLRPHSAEGNIQLADTVRPRRAASATGLRVIYAAGQDRAFRRLALSH
eukprot:592175-Pleurochrysis_carterae.AAC.1